MLLDTGTVLLLLDCQKEVLTDDVCLASHLLRFLLDGLGELLRISDEILLIFLLFLSHDVTREINSIADFFLPKADLLVVGELTVITLRTG